MRLGKSDTRRFLIVNAYSARNAGDAAIVLATAAVLRDTSGGEVLSATRYHEQDRDYYRQRGVSVVPPVIPFAPRPPGGSGKTRALTFVATLPLVFFIAALSRSRLQWALALARSLRLTGLVELLNCDRAVVCGGGYLYSYHRPLNLTLLHATLCVKIAEVAGRAPLMMPQSVGPLHRSLDQRLIRWGFRNVDPIVARDEIALAEARSLLPESRIELCPDIAFYGWPGSAEVAKPAETTVGIVVMDWTWARPIDATSALDEYVSKLARLARAFAADGISVRLYGHSRIPEMDQDDLAVAARVQKAAESDLVTVDPEGASGDVDTLHELFAGLDLVIGTRLHSCIVSMSAGTPAIGLAYQPKTTGTFELLGLPSLAFDVETFEEPAVRETAMTLLRAPHQREAVIRQVEATRERIRSFYESELSCA